MQAIQDREGIQEETKRLSKSEWHKLSNEWETSVLTQPEFCKQKGIKLTTFVYWRSKLSPSNKVPKVNKAKANFLPANIQAAVIKQPTSQAVNAAHGIMLRLPNGMNLQITPNTKKRLLIDVFELLGLTSC
jgi:hypothetical protein